MIINSVLAVLYGLTSACLIMAIADLPFLAIGVGLIVYSIAGYYGVIDKPQEN
jgi:hypothetical protein